MTQVRRLRRTAASVVAVISSLAGFGGMTSQRTDAADATEIGPGPHVDALVAETTALFSIPVTPGLGDQLGLPDPCGLITQAEAEAASGFPTRPGEVLPTEMVPLGTIQLCNFLAADTPADAVGGVAVIRVGVLDLGDDPTARFAEFAQYMGMSNGSVPGLGDENFYIEIEGTALLFLRTQNIFISVSALVPDGLAQATAIAQRALTRLGDTSAGGTLTSQAPGDAPVASTGATAAEWGDDRCGIVSEEVVSAVVGEAVTAQDFPPFGCQYLGDANGVVIDYFSIAAECEIAEARTDDPEIVDGLGVHAAFVSANIDEALAVTLDNGLCFFVHGSYGGGIDSNAARIAIAEAVIAPSGATGAEWPDDLCGIVSEELSGAAVGEAVTAQDYPPFGCYYDGDANDVAIYYYSTAAECETAEARTDDPEIVDGLGVHAAFVSRFLGGALAVTLDNGRCFFVNVGGDIDRDAVIAVAESVIAAS